MKLLTILLALMLLLTACTPISPATGPSTQPATSPSTTATTSPAQPLTFYLYTPDENFEGFVATEVTMTVLDPALILMNLIDGGVLAEDVQVLTVTVNGRQLALDMNEAFRDQVYTMGTTGERMIIGCLVNTFLSAYDCDCVMLTICGEILDSGHVVYSEPLYPFT